MYSPDLSKYLDAFGAGAAIIILIIFVLILLFAIWIAKQFQFAAKEKGYDKKRYFWIPFLFGLLGYLMVIALPDHGKKCQQDKPAEGASEA